MPFAPFPTATYRPGTGVLISPAHQPILEWYDLQGRLYSRIEITCLDTLCTATDRERFTRLWAARLAEYPERAESVRVLGDPSLIPSTKPAWTFIYIDDAGFYWLRCTEPV